MTRVGFKLKVKADRIAEYRERHRHVWPEMLDALRQAGWRNYSLFMDEDGTLFGYFETRDSLEAAQAAMETTAVNARWQDEMAPFFESPRSSRPDRMMIQLEEVFHLD